MDDDNDDQQVFRQLNPYKVNPPAILADNELIDHNIRYKTSFVNHFGVQILKELPMGDKNHVFCTVTLFSSFAMLYIGTGFKKKTDLENLVVANYGNVFITEKELTVLQSVIQMFAYEELKLRPNYQLFHVIRLLVDQSVKCSEKFKVLVKRYFNVDIDVIDFGRDWDIIGSQITQLIRSELNRSDVQSFNSKFDNRTQFVIMTAVDFKSKWEIEFPSNEIREEYFYNENERTSVQMMAIRNRKFRYGFVNDWDTHVVEIPFARKSLSFFLLLPKTVEGMERLLTTMKANDFYGETFNCLSDSKCDLFLPKFKLECDYDFAKLYHNLKVFKTNTEFKEIQHKVKANNVLHKVIFEITNSGVEPGDSPNQTVGDSPHIIRANHPFAFIVIDNRTWSFVFMGKVHSL